MFDPRIFEARPGNSAVLLPDAPLFTIVAVSNDFVASTGIPRAELLGSGFFDKFPESPLDPEFTGEQNMRASLEYVLQHRAPHGLPLQRYDVPNGDGSFTEKYWRPYNVPVLDDAGEVKYLLHTAEDVTGRVKAEKAEAAHRELEKAYRVVGESERKYRLLFESIDQGFCLVELLYDEHGTPVDHLFLETNPAYEQLTGLSGVAGKTARAVVPGIEPSWFARYDEVLRSGKPLRFTHESKALNRWFDVFAYPGGDADSKKVAVLFADVTEQKQGEQVLRESEARFRIMADAVPQSIWITDAQGKVEFLNRHWCDYCGEPFSETTAGDIAIRHLHPEDGGKVMAAFGEAMRTGTPLVVEQRNRSKDGEYRWFLNLANPYRDPDTGAIVKWFGVGIDIHDRKLAEQALRKSEEALERTVQERTQELKKANEELRRSNQNLEEFAYAASHDMKEPIRKIHFFADRLRGRLAGKLDEEEARYFERLEAGARRMATLIDDLLLYSHVNRGTSTLGLVDLNETLAHVLDDLELQVQERGARVEVGPLPAVPGYQRQLQQLFENLVGNALKYSRAGVPPVVRISARPASGGGTEAYADLLNPDLNYHRIEVSDNGIGFEQQDAQRIFNVFTRLHGNAEYRGTGVGLSIARKVVENHNGVIEASGRPGEGATFTILLPAG